MREKRKKPNERLEALMRIIVFIISGTILLVWRIFVYVLVIFHLIYAVITGKRIKDLAILGENWNTQWYVFQRYIIFVSNRRPFPFGRLEKRISKFNNSS